MFIEMKGEDFKNALEQMLALCPQPCGSYPHLSHHARMTYSVSRPKGNRILSLTIGGRPYEPEHLYRIALSEWLAGYDVVDSFLFASFQQQMYSCFDNWHIYRGGDGCVSFLQGQQVPSAVVDLGYKTVLINDLIVLWLRNRPNHEFVPTLEQRVMHIDTNSITI
jgi:hypothetical protein